MAKAMVMLTVDDKPDHHGNDDEELAEQQLQREQCDAGIDVEDAVAEPGRIDQ